MTALVNASAGNPSLAIVSAESPPNVVAVRFASTAKCLTASASGHMPSCAHTQPRRGPWSASNCSRRCRASAGFIEPDSTRAARSAFSIDSASSGQASRSANNPRSFGLARRNKSRIPGYSAGDSANRSHTPYQASLR